MVFKVNGLLLIKGWSVSERGSPDSIGDPDRAKSAGQRAGE
jgi:hypothetical protein